ncbi:BglG family transcription antiterminator [Sporolactobacillus sp. THM7-7]|nr:BglG family transcription antiterminator [Sporolactobacillus sp. THM7-7]
MLDQRAAQLLQTILNSRYVTFRQLEKITGFSRRQIQYDLNKINQWLEEHQLAPIINKRGYGLITNQETKERAQVNLENIPMAQYDLSEDERICLINLSLFLSIDYLSLQHFCSLLYLSRNTVLHLIKKANNRAEHHDVSITYNRKRGYAFTGNEWEIRNLARRSLSKLYHLQNGMEILDDLYAKMLKADTFTEKFEQVYQTIHRAEAAYQVHYAEENEKELSTYLVFLLVRMAHKSDFMFPEKLIRYYNETLGIRDTESFRIAERFLDSFQLKHRPEEYFYFTALFLGLQLKDGGRLLHHSTIDIDQKLKQAVHETVRRFEQLSLIELNQVQSFEKNLLAHIEPCYYRLVFDSPSFNPYLETIKNEYFDLFVIVRKSLESLERLVHKSIPDDEIGFLTLHFASFLKTEGVHVGRWKALIVCSNGIGVSNMLRQQLTSLFPEMDWPGVISVREFHEMDQDEADLIFSTVPLQSDKPLFMVKPILTTADRVKLIERVMAETRGVPIRFRAERILQIVRNYATIHDEEGLHEAITDLFISTAENYGKGGAPMLNQLLQKDEIQFRKNVKDWKEAIRVAAQPLIDREIVLPSYVEAMIDNVATIGPYIVITPHVAIPHARPENGVNQVGMSLLHLEQPVEFVEGDPETSVNIVIVLAAVDNKSHLRALRQLTELLGDDENIDQLMKTQSVDEIAELIEKYSA